MIIAWIIFSFIVAFVFGTARKIGFWLSFIASLLLSPLIGFILTLCSETNSKVNDRKKMIELQEQNNQLLRDLKNKS